jgi:nucleotide-binding universal stress UspA family protein
MVGMISQNDLFNALMSLTGIKRRGIHLAFEVEDRPGSIKTLVDIIRRYGGRMASILSSYDRAPQAPVMSTSGLIKSTGIKSLPWWKNCRQRPVCVTWSIIAKKDVRSSPPERSVERQERNRLAVKRINGRRRFVMNAIRRIMVAVDFSEISKTLSVMPWPWPKNVMRKSTSCTSSTNGILKPYVRSPKSPAPFHFPEQIEARREDLLAALMAILSEFTVDPPEAIARHVTTGVPYEALTRAIKEMDIDLVIMGTRGRGKFSGMLFGSTAARMLSKCPVPLLTLRNDT